MTKPALQVQGRRVELGQSAGLVFDIKKFSIHDGPGIRTTVFLKGCPLTCWWCHNPEGQALEPELILRPDRCIGCGACLDICEREAIVQERDIIVTRRERCTVCGACVEVCYADARELVGRRMTVDQVMEEVERDVVFYDQSGGGVTFSGGEPLAQPVFLRELLRACKTRGLHTTLDTCGYAPWEVLDDVRGDVDLFLYDLKLMDQARHRHFTGVSSEPILENLQELSRSGHHIVLRVPIIPGINDDAENLRQMGTFAASLPSLERIDLLPYHRIGRDKYRRLGKTCPMPETDPPSQARMEAIARTLRTFGLHVDLTY
jgi:pyruvate formate lyase activating enzyme